MGIRPDGVGVHEDRAAVGFSRLADRLPEHPVRGDRIATVDLVDGQARYAGEHLRDAAAGRLRLDRHRDGVLIVGNKEKKRRPPQAGGVDRFPEFTLAGRAVTARDVGDFVTLRLQCTAGFGTPDRL